MVKWTGCYHQRYSRDEEHSHQLRAPWRFWYLAAFSIQKEGWRRNQNFLLVLILPWCQYVLIIGHPKPSLNIELSSHSLMPTHSHPGHEEGKEEEREEWEKRWETWERSHLVSQKGGPDWHPPPKWAKLCEAKTRGQASACEPSSLLLALSGLLFLTQHLGSRESPNLTLRTLPANGQHAPWG